MVNVRVVSAALTSPSLILCRSLPPSLPVSPSLSVFLCLSLSPMSLPLPYSSPPLLFSLILLPYSFPPLLFILILHGFQVMYNDVTGPCLVEVGSRCHGGEGTWLPTIQECIGYTQVSTLPFIRLIGRKLR